MLTRSNHSLLNVVSTPNFSSVSYLGTICVDLFAATLSTPRFKFFWEEEEFPFKKKKER